MLSFSTTQPRVQPPHKPLLCTSLGGNRPPATSALPFRGSFKCCKKGVQQTSVRRTWWGIFFLKPCWLQVYWWSEFCWFTNLPKLLTHHFGGLFALLTRITNSPCYQTWWTTCFTVLGFFEPSEFSSAFSWNVEKKESFLKGLMWRKCLTTW